MELSRFNQLRDTAARVQHRDIGSVAANQGVDGLPVINRTKTMISPFAEIVKTPTYSENSGQHTGYAIEIEDDAAPHGFRHLGNVSERYLLMTNAEVYNLAQEVAEGSGLPWQPGRAFWDGGKFAVVLDFGDEVSQDVSASGDGSDRIGLSLVFRTSYDTSWRFEAALMGRRFLCDNGLLSGEFFGRDADRGAEIGGAGARVGDCVGGDPGDLAGKARGRAGIEGRDDHLGRLQLHLSSLRPSAKSRSSTTSTTAPAVSARAASSRSEFSASSTWPCA